LKSFSSNQVVEEKIPGPNDFIFLRTMEVYSIKNISDQENVTFLCCIANVYGGESIEPGKME